MLHTRERVLVVEDNSSFAHVLTRAFRARSFDVVAVSDASGAIAAAAATPIDYIVLDLKLGNESGLSLIRPLLALNVRSKILVLTGFSSIETAVDSIKAGACHYLVKPANIEEIMTGLGLGSTGMAGQTGAPRRNRSRSLDEIEWAHILQTLRDCGGNVSATARMLKMNMRTLQRKIASRKQKTGMANFLKDIRIKAFRKSDVAPPGLRTELTESGRSRQALLPD